MALLTYENVCVQRQNQEILHKISFAAEAGDIIGITAPSGAGKTTLLRLASYLDLPSEGKIYYQGKELAAYEPTQLRQQVGYVLQKPYLFGRTVLDNLEYPYALRGVAASFDEISGYLRKADLPLSILEQAKEQLSGGEQQRIAMIRSLLVKPQVLLLDEVCASLDEKATLLIEQLLLEEHRTRQLTLIFVTHSQAQLQRLAQKIFALADGACCYFGAATPYFQQRKEQLPHE